MEQKLCYDATKNSIAVRPKLSANEIKELLLTHFGLKVEPEWKPKEFNSYDDRNYFIEGELNERGNVVDEKYRYYNQFVLKIFNAMTTSKHKWYENINKYIHYCSSKCGNIKLPLPLFGLDNSTMTVLCEIPLQRDVEVVGSSLTLQEIAAKCKSITMRDGVYYVPHLVRLSVYAPGVLVDLEAMTNEQAFNFGKAVATLNVAMKEIAAPEVDIQETYTWNLISIIKNNFHNPYIDTLIDTERKKMAEDILEEFKCNTLPKLKTLPKQWIHSDANEQNMLYHEFGNCNEIAGILDFDDMVYSCRVVELGTSMMYITTTPKEERCMEYAKLFYQGYSSVITLNDIELDCIFNIMLVRYVQSCCIGLYQYNYVDPENDYLLVTNSTGWKNMKNFLMLGKDCFLKMLKE